jgi:vacuolar iron transporter family protein
VRAGVFGVNDGLVSNTSLVMGLAGSGAASTAIAFAGLAGLLAGAFSMAAGEYISMRSQREAYEREIALEAMELRDDPEAEAEELALIYRAKGLDPAEAERAAAAIMKDSSVALDTMAREELGLDPDELGSPWSAAFSSLFRSRSAPSSSCCPTFSAPAGPRRSSRPCWPPWRCSAWAQQSARSTAAVPCGRGHASC